jgi:hypothetical protein
LEKPLNFSIALYLPEKQGMLIRIAPLNTHKESLLINISLLESYQKILVNCVLNQR